MALVVTCMALLFVAATVAPALAKTGSIFGNGAWPAIVKYYTINDGTNFCRSAEPFETGVATQKHTANSVTVSTTNESGYADSGFVAYDGRLGDLTDFALKGTGSPFSVNLWFDADKDGQFFSWAGNTFLGAYGDTYGLGPASVDGVLTVNGDSAFYMMSAPYSSPTLDELKAGDFPGIGPDTHVTLWIGVSGATPQSATVAAPTVH